MTWRYLPPAHSPVSSASIAGSVRGFLRGGPLAPDQWLARRFEVDAALLFDSGTSALRVAIELSARAPARLALPAYGCFDLATAAVGAGARASFYDVDPATLGPDWPSLAAALATGVDAVVLVHQYGVPVDLDRARALCDAHGTLVIEDAAQGAGAWWRHRRLGARGDLGILSFGRGKGMTAGEGGALLASGPRGRELLARREAPVRRGGRGAGSVVRLAAQALLSHPMLYGVPARMPWLALGETPFHQPWEPHGISAAAAGVLPEAAQLADDEAVTRRQRAARLGQALNGLSGVSVFDAPSGEGTLAGWLRYPVLLDESVHARAISPAGRSLGVMAGYPRALPALPGVAGTAPAVLPGAARLAAGLVTLPVHRWVTESDIRAIVALLRG